MRIRYSLRLLLVATTLVAIGLYVLIIRPTAIANRFIDAVQRQHYDEAESVCVSVEQGSFQKIWKGAVANNRKVNATLMPRQPKDMWAFQRSLLLETEETNSITSYKY